MSIIVLKLSTVHPVIVIEVASTPSTKVDALVYFIMSLTSIVKTFVLIIEKKCHARRYYYRWA